MEVIHHRLVQRDLRNALLYYDSEGGEKLGDRFFMEVERVVEKVSENPKRFHFIADGIRRASMDTFPYHFLYEESETRIRFLVLRHDKRHPTFGLSRK